MPPGRLLPSLKMVLYCDSGHLSLLLSGCTFRCGNKQSIEKLRIEDLFKVNGESGREAFSHTWVSSNLYYHSYLYKISLHQIRKAVEKNISSSFPFTHHWFPKKLADKNPLYSYTGKSFHMGSNGWIIYHLLDFSYWRPEMYLKIENLKMSQYMKL